MSVQEQSRNGIVRQKGKSSDKAFPALVDEGETRGSKKYCNSENNVEFDGAKND